MSPIITIEQAKGIASRRGGKCLSTEYISGQKLIWECAKGHQWNQRIDLIKRGHWCPECRKLTIEEMQELASKKEGQCLSGSYKNSQSHLEWKCKNGHVWKARPSNIKRGYWCPYCAGQGRYTLQRLQNIAADRGGKLISNTVGNAKTKLLWECSQGHQWKGITCQIVAGRWCPACSDGLGERICRSFFEQLFGREFPKAKPKWLINKKGNQMELDGYNEDLKLAFEHHGSQHYEVGFYSNNQAILEQRQEDDKLKERLCASNDIFLIIIPEIPAKLPIDKIKGYIYEKREQKGFHVPADFNNKQVELKDAYCPNYIQELTEIAQKRKGDLLSKSYLGWNQKLMWECEKGHQWKAIPNHIKNGTWCPKCSGKNKTINDMQKLAEKKGGKCLSEKYINKKSKLLWMCSKGHQFKSTPDSITQGHWCPECAKNKKLTIEEMHSIAKARGGKCLSNNYTNAVSNLIWQCEKMHKWKAPAFRIKDRSWCPRCAGNVKATIEEMNKLAQNHMGKCLSDKYINAHTALDWKCNRGHRFKSTPHQVKRGQWCPKCARNKRLTIEEMRHIAEKRGGKCLSNAYINNRTKLLWQCSDGHQWFAAPHKIKSGQWCPSYRKQQQV